MRQIMESVGAPFEGARRFLGIGLFFIGFAMFMWTDFEPLIKVKSIDFAQEQGEITVWSEEDALLAEAPLDDFVLATTEGRTIDVAGADWEAFFAKALADQSGAVPKEWKFRHPKDWIYQDSLYFRPNEPPFLQISGSMRQNETYYLHLASKDQWLELWYAAPYEIGYLGGGRIRERPTAMTYPLSLPGQILMALSILVYIAFPWPKEGTIVVQMSKWRIFAMDLAACLMIIPFFVMPAFIVGSFQEAIVYYWFLTIWFFILSGLGLLMLYWGYRYASKRLYVYADRFRLYRGTRFEDYPFAEILSIEPLVIRPPKWLIVLTFMSAMAGGSAAQRAGQAGRGMLLAASQSDGLRITLKNGLRSCMWFGDSFGGKIVKNYSLIPQAIEKAQLPLVKEVQELRAFFPPER